LIGSLGRTVLLIRVDRFLSPLDWTVEHREAVVSDAVASEVLIAARIGGPD